MLVLFRLKVESTPPFLLFPFPVLIPGVDTLLHTIRHLLSFGLLAVRCRQLLFAFAIVVVVVVAAVLPGPP